jgi:hypothetical protein
MSRDQIEPSGRLASVRFSSMSPMGVQRNTFATVGATSTTTKAITSEMLRSRGI